MAVTKLAQLIDPEVLAPMIDAKLPKAITVTPFAEIDNTLSGQPGSTITIAKYEYIGDAEEVAEGVASGTAQLTTTDDDYEIKKVVKNVEITDEAVLSGYGDPVGQANAQIIKAIASKVDADAIAELQNSKLVADKSTEDISYDGIVDAIDLLQEEFNTDKVMFVAPTQLATLRKDADFISADKYDNRVMMSGEIGMIANTRIVPSRRIVKTKVGAEGSQKDVYLNPIVQLKPENSDTAYDVPALTIFVKRNVNVETDRNVVNKTTLISADEHYTVALTDESKVVVVQFKA